MMNKRFVAILLSGSMLFLSGCVSQSKYDQLASENKTLTEEVSSLKTEIDELKFGAGKLLTTTQSYYDKKDYDKSLEQINLLLQKHPDPPEAAKANTIKSAIEAQKAAAAKAAKQKKEAEIKQATQSLRSVKDDVQEITWYYDKTTTKYVNENAFYLYFGKQDTKAANLRMRFQYTGDGWVFIDSYIIKTDANSYTLTTSFGDVKSDNDGYGVWEWYDVGATSSDVEMVKDIIKSKKTIIRNQGDTKYYDHTVTDAEKKAMQHVLTAFEALSGK